jgi:hypothetical protein
VDKYILLWVYRDGDDAPYLIKNPPENLRALLAEWNALDQQYTEGQSSEPPVGWLPVNTWLRSKGIDVIEADEIHLDDCRKSRLMSQQRRLRPTTSQPQFEQKGRLP